jgi:hypothetical protein
VNHRKKYILCLLQAESPYWSYYLLTVLWPCSLNLMIFICLITTHWKCMGMQWAEWCILDHSIRWDFHATLALPLTNVLMVTLIRTLDSPIAILDMVARRKVPATVETETTQ